VFAVGRRAYPVFVVNGKRELSETTHTATGEVSDHLAVKDPLLPASICSGKVCQVFLTAIDHQLLQARSMPLDCTTEDAVDADSRVVAAFVLKEKDLKAVWRKRILEK